jgi:steroid delta-isomerase-like uncharacterized protein
VRSIYDGFNKQDIATVLGAVTPDFVLVDIPTGQSFHGPDGFLQWLQPFMVALPDSQTEVTRIIDGGEWIAAEHTGRGTHSGPLATPAGEIPASGRSIELQFAELFRIRDGKVAEMRAYWDLMTLLRQVGATD